jgi:CYTH domain-containing protein
MLHTIFCLTAEIVGREEALVYSAISTLYSPVERGIQRMALEIEGKFLLANDDWKREVIKSERLRDGLIARFGEGKVRARLTESNAWLTIKGPREGISRPEFEYEIPRADAEYMLRTLCQGDPVLEKVRHTVPFGGLDWTIDVYMGPLKGVVLAEIELTAGSRCGAGRSSSNTSARTRTPEPAPTVTSVGWGRSDQ